MSNTAINIEIIPFSDALAHHFSTLNAAWLKKFFVIEPIDQEMLDNPRHFFIDKGGFIYFASINGEIAGTFALLKVSERVYELSKMVVAENFRGMKIGNRMMEYSIQKATALKLAKLILYSNTVLQPAIHLYRKYGFTEVPVGNTQYLRCNIKMELAISNYEQDRSAI